MNETVFSTKSAWFRLASVYSDFPSRPEEFREEMHQYYDEDFANYRVDKELNICHYRWCVIKALFKCLMIVIGGSMLAAMMVVLPLIYVVVGLLTGSWDYMGGATPGIILWGVIALLGSLLVAIKLVDVALDRVKDNTARRPTPRLLREAHTMYDSLKNKYCTRLRFTDDE